MLSVLPDADSRRPDGRDLALAGRASVQSAFEEDLRRAHSLLAEARPRRRRRHGRLLRAVPRLGRRNARRRRPRRRQRPARRRGGLLGLIEARLEAQHRRAARRRLTPGAQSRRAAAPRSPPSICGDSGPTVAPNVAGDPALAVEQDLVEVPARRDALLARPGVERMRVARPVTGVISVMGKSMREVHLAELLDRRAARQLLAKAVRGHARAPSARASRYRS